MKKGIYLTIITIVTIICIIRGSIDHFGNFISFLPFSSWNTNSSNGQVSSSGTQMLEGFDNIRADVDVSDIIITRGVNYSIDYKATENIAPKYEVKNGTLTIKQTVDHHHSGGFETHNRSCTITITIPKDATLASIELDTNIGDVTVNGHNCKRNFSQTGGSGCSLTLDNSTGDISLSY